MIEYSRINNNQGNGVMKKSGKKYSYEEIMIGIFLMITGFLVRYAPVPLTLSEQAIRQSVLFWDAFQFYRGQALIVFTGILFITTFMGVYGKAYRLKADRFVYLFVGFFISVIASHGFSVDKELSFFGASDDYQGLMVMVCYVVLAALISLPRSKTLGGSTALFRMYSITSAVVACVSGIVSLLQYFGINPLESGVFRLLAAPASLGASQQLFRNEHMGFAFFGNPNYVSSMMVLLIPFVIHGALTAKERWVGWAMGLSAVIAQLGMLASASLSAAILAPVMYAVLFAGEVQQGIERRRVLAMAAAIFVPSVGFSLLPASGIYRHEILYGTLIWSTVTVVAIGLRKLNMSKKHLLVGTSLVLGGCILGAFILFPKLDVSTSGLLNQVQIAQSSVNIASTEMALKISVKNGVLSYSDESGSPIPFITDGGTTRFVDEKHKFITVTEKISSETRYIQIAPYGIRFFVLDNTFRFVNAAGVEDEIDAPDLLGSMKTAHVGTGRAYIWQTLLKLAANRPILGYGHGTVTTLFPQNDVVGKYNAFGEVYMLVDKPHNLYLQLLLYQGLLGLILFLGILFTTAQGLWMNLRSGYGGFSLPTLSALMGYSFVGLANDSKVTSAIFFWVLIGISVRMVREQSHAGKTV